MATQKIIEARKAAALEAHAEGLAEVNRKLDLILEHLGIESQEAVEPEPAPEPEPEPDSEPEGEPEPEPAPEKKTRKK